MRITIVAFLCFMTLIPSQGFAQDQILDWFQKGQYREIVDAVVNDPNADPNYIYVASDSLRRMRRYQEALDQYARLAAIGSYPWVYLGWCGGWEVLAEMGTSGAMANAVVACQWAADSAPGWVLPIYQLGRVENRHGLHLTAAAHQDWVISQVPWFSWPYYEAGASYLNEGGGGSNVSNGVGRMRQFTLMLNPSCPKPGEFELALVVCGDFGPWLCGIPPWEVNRCQ